MSMAGQPYPEARARSGTGVATAGAGRCFLPCGAGLDRAGDRMELVQVRHEEMAAFMACGHAKFTGEVGVCLATSGPGAIHLLNGLYDAKLRGRAPKPGS
jgi:thiamine pyrophosphate-dependent acetolactate synthase large subunit-like protein